MGNTGEPLNGAATSLFGWHLMIPLLLATALNPFNSAMLAAALVAIGRAFPSEPHIGAWLVASLYLTAGVAQPVLGTFADRFGARRTLLLSTAVLGFGATLGTFAAGMHGLVASRVLIAIGTSGAFPCSVSIIRHQAIAAGIAPPARLLGMLAAASAVSVALGPPMGGILAQWFGWRSVFTINLPLALVTITALYFLVPQDKPESRTSTSIDWAGIVLFALFMTALVIFLMRLPDGFNGLALTIAVICLIALIVVEQTRSSPFIDVPLLRANTPLALTYTNCLVFSFANYCVFYAVPQWSQAWLGLPLALSGFVLMPIAVSSTLGSLAPTVGRAGYMVELLGIASLILTCLGLLTLDQHSTLPALMALTFLFGAGYGILNMSNQQRLLDYAPLRQSGSAAGLLRTAQYCGAILSAPLVGYLMSGKLGDQPLHMLAWLILPLSLAPLWIWADDLRQGRVQGTRAQPVHQQISG